jgi:hypothetical protein
MDAEGPIDCAVAAQVIPNAQNMIARRFIKKIDLLLYK